MNLTTVANFTKRFLPVVLFFLLIVVLVFLIIYRFGRQQTPPLTPLTPPQLSGFNVKVGRFNSQNLTAPANLAATLPVYSLGPQADLRQRHQELASKLAFKNEPSQITDINFGQGLIYSNNQSSLVIYQDNLSYQKTFSAKLASGPFDQQTLKTTAANFLSSLGLSGQLPENVQISYLTLADEDLAQTANPSKANFIRFIFQPELAGAIVISPQKITSVTLDSAGTIVNFNYHQLATYDQIGQYPLIDFEKAINLLINQGALVQMTNQQAEGLLAVKQFSQTDLTRAYLAYWLGAKTPSILQPVWIFEGVGFNGETQIAVTFAVAAVDSKFFKTIK